MPRRKPSIPTYRRHRASGQAVVTLNDVDHYLGPWNTPQSRAEYDRIINEWLVRGRQLPTREGDPKDPLVKELVLGYWSYIAPIMPDVEGDKIRLALKPVRELFGDTKASEFGPVRYKAVRTRLVDSGLSISTIRDRLGILKRMIAWGVENELLPGDALHRIQAVAPLRVGREGVKASKKVKPVPEEHVQAILPQLSPTLRAMVELQVFIGARPGEIWRMTTGQIDRTGELWLYLPTKHKNVNRGKDRTIPLGPKAQEVLKPWLKADPDAPLFSPKEASERFYEASRKPRPAPKRPSRRKPEPKRKKAPRRVRGDWYTKNSYAQAIERACLRAGIPVFRPNQIRHTIATKVRRLFNLEAAQVLLGHSKADVTQHYAERDLALALEVAKRIG